MKKLQHLFAGICWFAFPIAVTADDLPMYDHQKQCGMQGQHMEPYTQKQMDHFLACILAERDAMGRLLDQWSSLDQDRRDGCIASSVKTGIPNVASYIEVEECAVIN